jgi:hypothetical protein
MASLHDVMVYLAKNYPYKSDLSNARLTKMIYLADWRAAIQCGKQITGLRWEFHHYGPYLDDVIKEAKRSRDFQIIDGQTMYGSRKQVIAVTPEASEGRLEPWEAEALDHVIRQTADLNWADFIELVYSTYPIVRMDRYSTLDLVRLAADYTELREILPN